MTRLKGNMKMWIWSSVVIIALIVVAIVFISLKQSVKPPQEIMANDSAFQAAGITPVLLMGLPLQQAGVQYATSSANGAARATAAFTTTSTVQQIWMYYTGYFKKNGWAGSLSDANFRKPSVYANSLT